LAAGVRQLGENYTAVRVDRIRQSLQARQQMVRVDADLPGRALAPLFDISSVRC
jgi:hypothetical protein